MADHSFILQHVHAKHIITDRQYQYIKHISQPEDRITNLIDQVICKGQETCSSFLEVLKQPDVLRTYPQLKHITKNGLLSTVIFEQCAKCNECLNCLILTSKDMRQSLADICGRKDSGVYLGCFL
uniref:CARD domain-containing protein n=1 Tax=Dicentrarchus labrax TaxID=13489 RepID=A0A8C4E379_DICLA